MYLSHVHICVYSDEETSTSAAPLPTTKSRKVQRVRVSTPGPRKQKTRTEAEEYRWHSREEDDVSPEPLKFMPARTPGLTFYTTALWTPLK